MALDAS
ncbi:hypothetical protein D043_1780A, partial [Vibrio parahaemolyticus EKP-021]